MKMTGVLGDLKHFRAKSCQEKSELRKSEKCKVKSQALPKSPIIRSIGKCVHRPLFKHSTRNHVSLDIAKQITQEGMRNLKGIICNIQKLTCFCHDLAQLLRHCNWCGRSGVRNQGRSNRTQCRRQLATAATFLRSYVAQTLSCGDMSRQTYTLRRNTTSMMKI